MLLFYLQNITEHDLRLDSTKEISQHIGSDLSLGMSMLDGLENSLYLQQGELGSDKTKKLIQEKYNKFNSIIDRLQHTYTRWWKMFYQYNESKCFLSLPLPVRGLLWF
jgi:hypothetical protein